MTSAPSMTFRLSLSKASNRVPFAATSNYATNLRPNKGFDATTCEPVEFTP